MNDFFGNPFLQLLLKGLGESLYMTVVSTVVAYIIGLPVGVLLVVTDKNGVIPCKPLNKILGFITNILRSVPFLIMLIVLIPFTRLVIGTAIGSTATIVPLVVSAAPLIARMVENSLKEVDGGVIDAARAMGASPVQIIFRVLIPEARPSLILGAAISLTTILGYSAMAGNVGGGGLGDIAIRYGYYRYQADSLLAAVLLLILIVQVFQEIGNKITKISDKRL
jgi:D-methionine transport system permease protein